MMYFYLCFLILLNYRFHKLYNLCKTRHSKGLTYLVHNILHGYGFLYVHNGGYGTITDISTDIVDKYEDIQTKRL